MNNTLAHYGILGMKWGVRRDNKPKARDMSDDDLQKSVRRMNLEKSYTELSKKRGPPSPLEKAKKAVDAVSSLVNQAHNANRESLNSKPKSRMDLSKMSDQDLRDQINRHNLERQYSDLFAPSDANISRGRQVASKVLDYGGTVLTAGSSALGIALAIKELRK